MNKNQEHSQQVFIQMVETLMSSVMRGEGLVDLDELADALTQQGVFNYYGQPYTAGALHKMIQRMDKVEEDLDFRQQHLPMYLQLKDNDIGLQTLTLPSTPIKRRTTKSDEELDREEMLILHEQHKGALPKGMRH
tara:strand:+ start:162 stop:566 length:405 start_codon:yes stop_codon:yes gene_type:complete